VQSCLERRYHRCRVSLRWRKDQEGIQLCGQELVERAAEAGALEISSPAIPIRIGIECGDKLDLG
jgi:hypothetical protein